MARKYGVEVDGTAFGYLGNGQTIEITRNQGFTLRVIDPRGSDYIINIPSGVHRRIQVYAGVFGIKGTVA